ncbi:hypothetical protein D9757_013512 [Collybiopsis confluens]|uniref:Uncharacterized protein n=1 Tax=Collybiopsis confluens TaxID=2823264 RepID=A0A8H5CPE0_9AGAR|nr:hypothetical protein D9757_013512 [Collybiopsis confluens]
MPSSWQSYSPGSHISLPPISHLLNDIDEATSRYSTSSSLPIIKHGHRKVLSSRPSEARATSDSQGSDTRSLGALLHSNSKSLHQGYSSQTSCRYGDHTPVSAEYNKHNNVNSHGPSSGHREIFGENDSRSRNLPSSLPSESFPRTIVPGQHQIPSSAASASDGRGRRYNLVALERVPGHTGEDAKLNYTCNYCRKGFLRPSALKSSLEAIQSFHRDADGGDALLMWLPWSGREVVCLVFIRATCWLHGILTMILSLLWQTHTITHTGDQEADCLKRFGVRSNMLRHVRRMHQNLLQVSGEQLSPDEWETSKETHPWTLIATPITTN